MRSATESRILSVASYVPPRRMTNDELAKTVDTSDEWIYSHTGIKARHIAADDMAASDLAAAAVTLAIERAGIGPNEIDLILVATSTPDYAGFPSTAAIVQDKVGASRAAAMDLVAACTGFVYGLTTAHSFVASGEARNVVVVGTEVFSKILNWNDRNTCVLFGDGAGAVVLQGTKAENGKPARGVLGSYLRSRGNGAETLCRPVGGTKTPLVAGQIEIENTKLFMDGRAVYKFAVGAIIEVIDTILEQSDLTLEQVDHVVPHQANVRIMEAACRRAGYPTGKFYSNIADYANTSGASIPIALAEMEETGLLKPGQSVLTVGFGAGLTYGGNLIRW